MKEISETIAVIGGGVSGIAAAHYLLKQGFRVDLYEADARLGGRMGIDELGSAEVCFGGKNIGYQYNEFRTFLETYGEPKYEYFGINSARLVRGRLKIYNSKKKFRSLLTLLSMATFSDLRLLKASMEAIQTERLNGDLCGPYFKTLSETGGQKLSDHFSPKFVSEFLRALTVRMNGAEPHDIGMENLGTHLQMLLDEYQQLSSSTMPIMKAFQKTQDLAVFLKTPITQMFKNEDGFTLITREQSVSYAKVVIALSAYAAVKLLKPHLPRIAKPLELVRYRPVGVIVANYEYNVFKESMRALTFGPDFPISNIGAYGLNTLNRVRYTFSGEAAEDVLHESLDDTHLFNMAEAQAVPFFNLKDNPCREFKVKYWAQGLCAYTKDEARFKGHLKSALRTTPGLYLTGDYKTGASIENCFRASKSTVQDIVKTKLRTHLHKQELETEILIGKTYVEN